MSRMMARETTMPAPAARPCSARKNTSAPIDGERAAHRSQREQADPQHHPAAAEAVGQRAVEQVHRREAEQVARQRLLHLHRRGLQRTRDAGEGRQVGVDRERPEHAQAGKQHGQRPARSAPEGGSVRVHRGNPSVVWGCSSGASMSR
jgi:hypothetical protein